MRTFTNADRVTIKAWYGKTSTERLAAQMRRSVEDIDAEAARIGMPKPNPAKIRKAEATELGPAVVAAKPKAEKAAPPKERRRDGRFRQGCLTEDMKRQVRQMYPYTINKKVADALGVTLSVITNFALREGLRKQPGFRSTLMADRKERRKPCAWKSRENLYTAQELDTIRALNDSHTHAEIAEIIGRSESSVSRHANILGLSKPLGFKSPLTKCLFKARYHLNRGDHLTALNLIEQAIKAQGERKCKLDTTQ